MTITAGLTRWTNNATTDLNGGINGIVTSLVVDSALGFPNPGPFRILIDNELMQVTAGYGTTTWTVVRGIEGTAPASHADEASIIHDVTAFEFNSFRQEFNIMAYAPTADGVADESTPFQNAYNDAHAQTNGGIIFLPSYNFKLNSALTGNYNNVVFVTYGAVLSGAGASSVTPLIRWSAAGGLTLPGALTVSSGGAAVTGAISSTSILTGTAFIPTGLTGATAVSRYVGGTSSGAPVSGTFAIGDFVITRDGFIYVCIVAGTPGTWQQPAPSLTFGSASDIKPLGAAAAAGASGKVADASHIHAWDDLGVLDVARTWTALQTFSGGISGTVQTAAQGNITTLGTLTSLNVSGPASLTNTLTVTSGITLTTGSAQFQNGTSINTEILRIGKVNASGVGVQPDYGGILYFSGGPAPATTFDSDNSDPLWIARYNAASNQSELRINIGDDPGSTDALVVGLTTGSWAARFTMDMSGRLTMPGPLALTTAASKLIPGATSLSFRNNADSADNLIITDAGASTFRSTATFNAAVIANSTVTATSDVRTAARLIAGADPGGGANGDVIANRGGSSPGSGVIYFGSSGGTHYLYYDGTQFNLTARLVLAGTFVLSPASSKIVPGTTQLSLRNNADNADNLLISDAGAITVRSTIGGVTTLTATTLAGTLSTAAQPNVTSVGTLTSLTTSGTVSITAAASKIVPGSTSLTLRNNADNADNLKLDDGGAAHFRSTVDGISTITATTFSGALSGNATTATTLQTARNINSVSFNGSADITVTAAAGTLTGGTLASGVTASSLTSVGTLGSLTMGGTLSKGSNALTGSRNSSDIYPIIGSTSTVATGVQIFIQATDPGGNNGDIWVQA